MAAHNQIKRLGALLLGLAWATAAQAQLFPNLGGSRVGISALTFLKNDLSPRSAGLGGANATLSGDAYAATLNPALAAEVKSITVGVSNMYFADGINHSLVSVMVPNKERGTFYGQVHMLNMGAEKVRTEFFPQGTGQYFTTYSLSAEAGYSRDLSERFSFGLGFKFLREQLAEYAANGLGADVGFLYRTDWRNLRFGATLQHFGTNATLRGNRVPDLLQRGQTVNVEGYPAPTHFKMGASMDAIRKDEHLLTVHLQLNHPNDNAENIRAGAEYIWANTLALRAGLKLGVDNERTPSAGIGYRQPIGGHMLQIDYGVNPTRFLGLIHSVGISYALARPAQNANPAQP